MKNFAFVALLTGLAPLSAPGVALGQSNDDTPVVEEAIVRGSISRKHKIYKYANERLVVSHLNGKSLWQPSLASLFTSHVEYPEEIKVPPGRHYLSIHYSKGEGASIIYANEKFWLDAKAGQTYQLKSDIVGRAIRMWIEEADTGRSVGGTFSEEARLAAPPAA